MEIKGTGGDAPAAADVPGARGRWDDQGPELERIVMVEKSQRFEIEVEGEPDGVVLDPNTWILMQFAVERC